MDIFKNLLEYKYAVGGDFTQLIAQYSDEFTFAQISKVPLIGFPTHCIDDVLSLLFATTTAHCNIRELTYIFFLTVFPNEIFHETSISHDNYSLTNPSIMPFVMQQTRKLERHNGVQQIAII